MPTTFVTPSILVTDVINCHHHRFTALQSIHHDVNPRLLIIPSTVERNPVLEFITHKTCKREQEHSSYPDPQRQNVADSSISFAEVTFLVQDVPSLRKSRSAVLHIAASVVEIMVAV